MLDVLYPLVRPAIFAMDAERAHEWTLGMLSSAPGLMGGLAGVTMKSPAPALHVELAGLTLKGPVGLAAGLDKNGVAIRFWPRCGFGFVEVGTVTAHPQPGNPRPRLFRLKDEAALINRMGFNNEGSEALAHRLRALREADLWPDVPVGANLGKSKVTPLDEAPQDYVTSTERLAGLADYFTVNVSSPNTPGLRSLQDRDTLANLLPRVQDAAKDTPVFLKLAPDLTDEAIVDAVQLARELGIGAVIATNTTIRRDVLKQDPNEGGGLSGRPLWPIARKCIDVALEAAGSNLPIIGVGGIETADQVQELLDAGCRAVQLYTAFIYKGPGLPHQLNQQLLARRA